MKVGTERRRKQFKKKFKRIGSKYSRNKYVSFSLTQMVIAIIFAIVVTSVITGAVVYKNYGKLKDTEKVSVNNNDDLSEFIKAYNNILDGYVEKVDKEKLIDAAIEGMYSTLDEYTTYLDEEVTKSLKEQLNGEYGGIGVQITKNEDGTILISDVFENSTAEEAGLKAGDIILKVDDVSVTDLTLAEAADKIKSSFEVNLTYKRDGKEYTIPLAVRTVQIPSVSTENFDGIGYIYVSTFSMTTYDQFKSKLEALESKNINSLIIDLRGNTGGYLHVAKQMSELFLQKGDVIYGMQYRNGKEEYVKDSTAESRNYKIVVLLNSGSASASEILASALKDSYGATIIGTTSYGKGTVQETSDLTSGSMVKYTTAHWLTPSGKNIDGEGIKPDIEVNLNKYDEYSYKVDNQLQEAIKYLKK